MSKRLAFRGPNLKAWHMHTLEGRQIAVIYDTTKHDHEDAEKIARQLIPRGWKPSSDRAPRIQPGRYELPIRRATRTVGR